MTRRNVAYLFMFFLMASQYSLAQDNLHIMKLESEMLRLISGNDRDGFMEITERLKTECQKQGNERLFYTAWGNQATFEATHQNYVKADQVADRIAEYAEDQNSYWGNYIALHTRGFSDILGTKDYELQPEEREELSNLIKQNSKHITRLIDEMAELSLYESKKSLPVDYTLSPNHICRLMVDSMRPRCKEGVRMFFESDLSDDYAIQTNQEALEALLNHLLTNAIQYTDHGVITLACTEYEDWVRISVTDTGRGISEEQREHLFDTYSEVGDNVKFNGLGLIICRSIVRLLRGEIWLDSNYTEGSRFVVELPR